MPLYLGDVFPDFEADSTVGKIKFHEQIEGKWAILFSHPADYTPVCTTELGRAACLHSDFKKRGCSVFALSCDSVEDHKGWSKDVMAYEATIEKGKQQDSKVAELPFVIIADEKRNLAEKLGMVDPDEKDKSGLPLTCRAVFIIGPDKKLKLSFLYPATTGRNFDEILRVLDSLQLTANKKVATPENWKVGDKCMVLPTISDEDAKKLFKEGGVETRSMPSGKSYMRYTPHPK
ncbi:Peroxiredoxin-6 [Nucella lapillus]